MKKYPKYKPSGVEWIGDVPEGWEVKKLKYFAEIFGGTTPESGNDEFWDGEIFWVTPEDLGKLNGIFIQDTKRKITQKGFDSCKLKVAPSNSLIISGRAPIGHLGILKMPASTNQGCKAMVFNESSICLYYYFLLLLSKEDLNSLGKGTTFLELSTQNLKDYQVPFPPLSEQTAIAAYLDRKTAQIDQSIAEKERLIELFREERQAIINHAVTKGIRTGAKMKPSGVEWIGDVPEGWEVKKLKHIAAIFGRIGFRGYTVNDIVEEGQGVITLSPGNIKNDVLTLESAAYLSFEKYYESPEIMIFPEDIVLVKTGSTIGKTAIIPESVPEMTLNPQLVVLKDLKVLPKFLYYQTTCPFFKNMFEVEQTGGTTPTISQEKINSFPVVIPPEIEEQKEVVNFIDQKTAQIDTAISGIRQEIALLQEYRQALIFEAVTGKIKVI